MERGSDEGPPFTQVSAPGAAAGSAGDRNGTRRASSRALFALATSLVVHGAGIGGVIAWAPRVTKHGAVMFVEEGGGRDEDFVAVAPLAASESAAISERDLPPLEDVRANEPGRPTGEPTATHPAAVRSAIPPRATAAGATNARASATTSPTTSGTPTAIRSNTAEESEEGDIAIPTRRTAQADESESRSSRIDRPGPAAPETPDAGTLPSPANPARDAAMASDVTPARAPASAADAGVGFDAATHEARPPAILTVGIQQSEHGEHVAGALAAVVAGNPALATFIARLQAAVAANARIVEVYRKAHPNYHEERIDSRTATLQLRITRDGTLEQATIVARSGSEAFDQEAMAAVRRVRPLPAPPASVLNDQGTYSLRFTFHLDLRAQLFYSDVGRMVAKRWHPLPVYRRFGTIDRTTVVRALVGKTGTLVHRTVITSSGIDFLDRVALEALPVGGALATPPPGLRPSGHLVPVRIKFVHAVRGADLVSTGRDRPDGDDADSGTAAPTRR
jgi:TonB family protein